MTPKTLFRITLLVSVLLLSSLACGVCGLEAFLPRSVPSEVVEVPREEPTVSLPTITPIPPKMPRTVTLRADGSGDYPTLQSAVADLMAGSTITLEAGEFPITAPLEVNYSLTIRGQGMDSTIITGNTGPTMLKFTGPGSLVLENLAFSYRGSDHANILDVSDAELMVSNCRFSGAVRDLEQKTGGSGLVVRSASSGTIISSTFEDNMLHGVSLMGNANFLVSDSQFINSGQSGLLFSDDAIGEVRNCSSQYNGYHGFSTMERSNVLFENNLSFNNLENGFFAMDDSLMTARSNQSYYNGLHGFSIKDKASVILEDNMAYDNVEAGIRITDFAFLDAMRNDVSGNGLSGIITLGESMSKLSYNTVYGNGEGGIRVGGNAYVEAIYNTVYGNALSGFIGVENGYLVAENNTSRDNLQSGFSFFDYSSGKLVANTCSGNTNKGISIHDSANPTVGTNNCP